MTSGPTPGKEDVGDTEVLYIAGTARSGSTVLAILLNASPAVVSPGEVSFFFRDVALADKPCSCGESSSDCALWSYVLDACPAASVEEAERLERLTRSVDSHVAMPRHLLRLTRRQRLERYCAVQVRLFRAISESTGAGLIVDSSKYAARALALKRCLGTKIRVLCLTRSPRGVVNSFLKPNRLEQPQSSVPFAVAYYSTVLVQLRAMAMDSDDVLEITYEELSRDPVATVERIEAWGGWELARTRHMLKAGARFDVGHMVTGNRVRKEGEIRFRPERESSPASIGARIAARVLDAWRRVLGFRRG